MEKNLKKDCQSVQKRQREGKREGKARQLQNVLCYTQTHTHTHTHTRTYTHTQTGIAVAKIFELHANAKKARSYGK